MQIRSHHISLQFTANDVVNVWLGHEQALEGLTYEPEEGWECTGVYVYAEGIATLAHAAFLVRPDTLARTLFRKFGDEHAQKNPQVAAVLAKVRARGESIPPVADMPTGLREALCLEVLNAPSWLEIQYMLQQTQQPDTFCSYLNDAVRAGNQLVCGSKEPSSV